MARKTPAEVVIDAFGIRPLARDLGCNLTTVYRWRESPGGLIPARWHAPLLKLARERRQTDITAAVLVYGK